MTDHDLERSLIRRASAGDRVAVALLLGRYHRRLLRAISRNLPASVRSRACPDDVLQDTVYRVFKSLPSFSGDSAESFYAWCWTIAKWRIIDLTRRVATERRIHQTHGKRSLSIVDTLVAQAPEPRALAENAEAIKALKRGLAALSRDYRQVLELRYIQALPVAVVAEMMGRSPGRRRCSFRGQWPSSEKSWGQQEPFSVRAESRFLQK